MKQLQRPLRRAKTWTDLYLLASTPGPDQERWQKVVIVGLHNLGCDHLANGRRQVGAKWIRYYHGLQDYVGSLVGEYGIPEGKAFRETLDEVNNVRDCIDGIKLED